jgi:hypothetical protein
LATGLRVAELRIQATTALVEVRSRLTDLELPGLESGMIQEIAVPAIDRAIAALKLNPTLVQEWLAMQRDVEEGLDLLRRARQAFGYVVGVAAVSEVVDLLLMAEEAIRGLGL